MNLIFKDIQLVIDLLNDEVARLEKLKTQDVEGNPMIALQEYTNSKGSSLASITKEEAEDFKSKFDSRIDYVKSVSDKFQNEVDKASFSFSLRQGRQDHNNGIQTIK